MVNSILALQAHALDEERKVEPIIHPALNNFSNRFGLGRTLLPRSPTDTFFARRHGCRAIRP